ncbi:MAG: NAD(P)-binding domain-containing protein [Sphingorhabdus sp.]
MTRPATLPLVGVVKFGEVSKETLLEFWEGVVRDTGLELHLEERVDSITNDGTIFDVQTTAGRFRTKTVLLAIGRRGTPRMLGVPGEERSKVVYRLIDPEQYKGQRVLVVGGGDSALEAAGSIADEEGTHVTLSYRGDAFGRARAKNRDRVNEAAANGRLDVMLNSTVQEIASDHVLLSTANGQCSIENDAVIVCAGGILPTAFLNDIGVRVETKYGTVQNTGGSRYLGSGLIKNAFEASKWQRYRRKMAAADSHSIGKVILRRDRSHFGVLWI